MGTSKKQMGQGTRNGGKMKRSHFNGFRVFERNEQTWSIPRRVQSRGAFPPLWDLRSHEGDVLMGPILPMESLFIAVYGLVRATPPVLAALLSC